MEGTGTAGNVKIFEDPQQVARAGADLFVSTANTSISNRGLFTVALAGGSTPRLMYELLSTEEYKDRVDWPKVHIFFGDERCVEPTDPESNYRMADEAMLSRLPIPSYNVHRIVGEGDAVANASLYEDDLRTFFDPAPFPNFDLVLLGMGPDGHTASLFPGTPALNEKKMWVVANWVAKLGSYRLTLTPPAINHAANIVFLVTGESKAERLPEVLGAVRDPQRLPCQLIQPLPGSSLWLVDKEAAQRL